MSDFLSIFAVVFNNRPHTDEGFPIVPIASIRQLMSELLNS